MNEVLKPFEGRAWLISTLTLILTLSAFVTQPGEVDAADNIQAYPCDTRDTCSADPEKYATYRDNGQIKAREYVAEMRWGTGGAPDDAYVISKIVSSRDFANAKPCHVRDACIGGQSSYKVVRSGPSGTESTTAGKSDGVKVATEPTQK